MRPGLSVGLVDSDRPQPDQHRLAETAELLALHRDAFCRCVWCDRPDEAAYHLAEIERLERQ